MSTRSGKRIHTSLLEDAVATEVESAPKTERKTRGKRVKENIDELSVSIFKNKKRNNYVSYPIDDEPLGDTATKKDGEAKPSRAIRKNVLKEHNTVENSDQLESQTEAKSFTRKSRRFKRVDAEETDNHENVAAEVIEVPKSKKGKKKKKVEAIVENPPTEENLQVSEKAPDKKSKKKKKKGKRASYTLVEDVPENNDSKNRSVMSVDSFHSAAGSPYKSENIDAVHDDKLNNSFEKTEEIIKPSKTNRRKNEKISNNNNFDNNNKSVNMEIIENKKHNKSTKKRKPVSEETGLEQCFVSVARDNLEKGLDDILKFSNLADGHLRRKKSNTRDATVDKSSIPTNLEKVAETNADVFNVSKRQSKRRKSSVKEVNEVSLPGSKLGDESNKNNETFDKGLRSRNSFVKDVTFDKIKESIQKKKIDSNDILDDSNISKNYLKARRSMIKDSIFDKSNASIANEIVENTVDVDCSDVSDKLPKTRRSMLKDSTFDKSNASIAKEFVENSVVADDSNISKNHLKTRKSFEKDNTFDKSHTSIVKEIVESDGDADVSISNYKFKTRRSFIKDNTFDKSNTSIVKEIVESDADVSISNYKFKTRRSFIKDSIFDKSNASIAKEEPAEDVDLNNSTRFSKTRKSILKDSTFDKSNASITNVNIEKDTEPDLNGSNKQLRRRKSYVKDTTFEKQETVLNTTFDKETENGKETVKDSTFSESNGNHLHATYEKDLETNTSTSKRKENISSENAIFNKNTSFERDTSSSFDAFKKGAMTRKSSIRDASFDKSNFSFASLIRLTKSSLIKDDFEKDNNIILSSSATKRRSIRHTFDNNDTSSDNINTTYEKTENTDHELKRKSSRLSKTPDIHTVLNTTFEKENTNGEKENLISSSKSSLISSDNSSVTDKSDISRISITSDDTSEHVENIINTTPLLIESSVDESHTSMTKPESPKPQTPLKREGTFTKEVPEQIEAQVETPTKRKSVPTAGCTPFHVGKSSQKKSMLNVTRSLEKGFRASVDPAPRLTRVMFCSPVDNPVTFTQEKRKIIKSNLKGSNKSFVFDENASMSRPARKRSYTQNDAEDSRVKRTRLTEDLQHSVERLSRPRTASATAKLAVTPKKPTTPSKPKSDGKPSRTKLPNFAAMHQKQFDKMESLDECQERRTKRAKQLLTPTAPPGLLERISPKNNTESPKKSKESAKPKEKIDTPTKKTDTPSKKLPTLESLRPGFTRFGFKLNLDVNPFSIPSKTAEKPKEKPVEKPNVTLPRQGILPSLAGATSVRREVAKLTVMREKSFTDRRNVKRNENRTVIKGVRTNRRFELQMKMRNID